MTQVTTTSTAIIGIKQPFIGLRPFEKSEKALFFGRSKEVEEILRKLKTTRFLAVVGASGSGKTSLIQAGLVPQLLSGFEGQGGTKWGIAMFTPGRNPIGNLANVLAQRNVLSPDIKAEPNSEKIEQTLRRSSLGLTNVVKERIEALKDKNLLIVINKFEQLFDLMDEDDKKNEARDFVKLLLRAVSEQTLPIYVLIAIESDALSEITKFRGLPEVVNQGQYLMPRMTKQDLRKVILTPLEVIEVQMQETLRGTLLDDIENTNDQLPVLEHALMRIWEHWQRAKDADDDLLEIEGKYYRAIGEFDENLKYDFEEKKEKYKGIMPAQSGLSIYKIRKVLEGIQKKENLTDEDIDNTINTYQLNLELEHYSTIRKPMDKALGIHAEEVFYTLTLQQKKIAEYIFKSIIDATRGIENVKTEPTEIGRLAAISDVSVAETKSVIELLMRHHFIQANETDLSAKTTITLTHGALARKWNRLKRWIEEEAESSKTYLRLAQDAAIHLSTPDKQGLWRDNQLQFGEDWYNEQAPNQAWARQYHEGFETAIRFLENGIARRNADIEAARKQKEQEDRRKRIILWSVVTAALICLGLAGWAVSESRKAEISKSEAEMKAQEALLSKLEAENEKRNASVSAREAKRQAVIANEKELIAQDASKKADIQARKARIAADAARKAADEAKRQEKIAVQQGKIAEREKENAKQKAIEAEKAEAVARTAEAVAQKLKYQSLAEAIAIKSVTIENQNQERAQIAKKAHEIYLKSDPSLREVSNPEIYRALYYGVKGLKTDSKNENFNEFLPNNSRKGTIHGIINRGGDIYMVGSDGVIFKWAVSKWNAVEKPTVVSQNIGKIDGTTLSFDISDNGNLVTGGKDRLLSIFKLSEPQNPTKINAHNDRFIWKALFVDNNRVISSGEDKQISITNITTKTVQKLWTNDVNIREMDLHVNRETLVLGDDKGMVWAMNISNPDEVAKAKISTGSAITALRLSPNGKYLAVGNQRGKLYVYAFPSMSLLYEYEAHTVTIADIQFRNNESFVTASHDKTSKFWEISKMRNDYAPIVFDDHNDWCTAVSFSQDGNQVIIGCKDGTVKIWAVKASTLSNELCELLKNKQIAKKDWDKYIGNDVDLKETVCEDF